MDEQRVGVISFSAELLSEALALPEGTVIHNAWWEPVGSIGGIVHFLAEHPDFKPVSINKRAPRIKINYEVKMDERPRTWDWMEVTWDLTG